MKDNKPKVIVIGDTVIDEYIFLKQKNSTEHVGEKLIPTYDITRIIKRMGGAYNVAYLLANKLGSITVDYITALGDEFRYDPNSNIDFIDLDGNPTGKVSVKRRYVENEFFKTKERHDYYKPTKKISHQYMYDIIKNQDFASADCVVMSDYLKGTLNKQITQHIIANSKTVIVDTKNPNLENYSGANYIKLNENEYRNIVSACVSAEAFAESVLSTGAQLIVTRGSKNTMLVDIQYEVHLDDAGAIIMESEFPTIKEDPVNIIDTVGCGDAFVAGFAGYVAQNPEYDITSAIDAGHALAHASLNKLGAQW